VVRRCVWSRNLVNEEALANWGLSRQQNKTKQNKTKHTGLPTSVARAVAFNAKQYVFVAGHRFS